MSKLFKYMIVSNKGSRMGEPSYGYQMSELLNDGFEISEAYSTADAMHYVLIKEDESTV